MHLFRAICALAAVAPYPLAAMAGEISDTIAKAARAHAMFVMPALADKYCPGMRVDPVAVIAAIENLAGSDTAGAELVRLKDEPQGKAYLDQQTKLFSNRLQGQLLCRSVWLKWGPDGLDQKGLVTKR